MRLSQWLTSLTLSTAITASTPNNNYSTWMADSIISRGQGIAPEAPTASTYLQIGIVQNALLRLLESPVASYSAREKYRVYVQQGTESILDKLLNASQDTLYPLDRFSLGRGLLAEYLSDDDEEEDKQAVKDALDALNGSIALQPRNQYGRILLLLLILWGNADINRRIMVLYLPQLELSRRNVLLHFLCVALHRLLRSIWYTRDHICHHRAIRFAMVLLLRQHHGSPLPWLWCLQNRRVGEPDHGRESHCLGPGNGMVFHGAG